MEIILWALGTGAVTGAAWVGILLLNRRRTMTSDRDRQVADLARRVRELEGVDRRLTEAEDRLDFAERLAARKRDPQP
jgi:predicted O-methyltransferase YrrM